MSVSPTGEANVSLTKHHIDRGWFSILLGLPAFLSLTALAVCLLLLFAERSGIISSFGSLEAFGYLGLFLSYVAAGGAVWCIITITPAWILWRKSLSHRLRIISKILYGASFLMIIILGIFILNQALEEQRHLKEYENRSSSNQTVY